MTLPGIVVQDKSKKAYKKLMSSLRVAGEITITAKIPSSELLTITSGDEITVIATGEKIKFYGYQPKAGLLACYKEGCDYLYWYWPWELWYA